MRKIWNSLRRTERITKYLNAPPIYLYPYAADQELSSNVELCPTQLIGGVYGMEHKEYTVFGETRDIAQDMERLSDTYRILVSQDFIQDLQKYNGFTYIRNTDKARKHDKVRTFWLLGRAKYAEQNALNEINEEYGAIRDGKVPPRPEAKKKTQMGGVKAPALSDRAIQRRGSMKTHQATQERSKQPSILERRQVGSKIKKIILPRSDAFISVLILIFRQISKKYNNETIYLSLNKSNQIQFNKIK